MAQRTKMIFNSSMALILILHVALLSKSIECFTPSSPFIHHKNILSPLKVVSFNKQVSISNDTNTNTIIFQEQTIKTSPQNNTKSSVFVSILISEKTKHHPSKKRKKKLKSKSKNKDKVSAKIQEELLSQEVQEINKKIAKHKHHTNTLDSLPCLVLNADYQVSAMSL